MKRRSAASLLLAALLAHPLPLPAQESPISEHESGLVPRQPVRGRFYYVIEDLTAGRIVRRGVADAEGDIHSGLLLGARRQFREGLLHARTLRFGFSEFVTPEPGQAFRFPNTTFADPHPLASDTDGDGLPDTAEVITGTDPAKADTDGDGLSDAHEIRAGGDPLDRGGAVTGLLAAGEAPGEAQDVDASNDVVALAMGSTGVALFNVGLGFTPVLAAQVDTPGTAHRVALGSGFAAAADGPAGIALVDLAALSRPVAAANVPFDSEVRSVAAANRLVFAGLADGSVALVEASTRSVVHRVPLGSGGVRDLFLNGDHLFALVGDGLVVARLEVNDLQVLAQVPSPIYNGPASTRLFVGGGIAYVVHGKGYNTFDVSDPAQPRLLATRDQLEFGWKHLVANGTGLGLVAASPNASFDGPHKVRLYDLRNPSVVSAFLDQFDSLQGVARAVALYNGLAYVAVSPGLAQENGPALQVLQYLPPDAAGQRPSITLEAGFSLDPAQAEEGKLVRLTANVADDVQVRSVEFFLDGERLVADGNFPFEARFVTPHLAAGKTNFVLSARATDTGGNATRTADLTVTLIPDATPPRVLSLTPKADSLVFSLEGLVVRLNEPLDPLALVASGFHLTWAGADAVLDTPDDLKLSGLPTLASGANLAILPLAPPAAPGLYQARFGPPAADLAGNRLAGDTVWRFALLDPRDPVGDLPDADRDGVPDFVERLLGLDPTNAGDGNGDVDGDQLGTAFELRFGLDPRVRDSDGDGLPDGEEDFDYDGASNLLEFQRGLDPFHPDTDRDGWFDNDELLAGSDPTTGTSVPQLPRVSRPVALLNASPTLPPPPAERLRLSPRVAYRHE